MLAAGGYRVGLYTSPHLVELTERVRVGGREIAREELVALADEIRATATGRGIGLTFFEFLTVLALLHFGRTGIDVAVVEVGLGGRLDATNVIDPLACAITTIGYDHMQWLGSTLAEIAGEKGGIIKPGRPVVLGRIDGEASAVLTSIAAVVGAPVFALGRDYALRAGSCGLELDGFGRRVSDLRVGLAGAHQQDNAATAVAMLTCVREALPLSDAAIRRGLARVRWPGRLEIVDGAPLTIFDGAHNVEGMTALAREVVTLAQQRPVHLLFAVMGDKDWQPMVERIAPLCASATVTEVLRPRGAAATRVGDAFRPFCETIVEADPRRAWQRVRARAQPGDAIVVTGSLFLIGALYAAGGSPGRYAAGLPGALHP